MYTIENDYNTSVVQVNGEWDLRCRVENTAFETREEAESVMRYLLKKYNSNIAMWVELM